MCCVCTSWVVEALFSWMDRGTCDGSLGRSRQKGFSVVTLHQPHLECLSVQMAALER